MMLDYWMAKTYATRADLHRKTGETSMAIDCLTKAMEIFTECGANGWVEKYEKELAAL